ncbi:potassium channel family protein [Tomitella fengzijianii]|uniref:Potassium channel family protein n=1 Tax=Tomitella fengzijianii TaxID=2597660 RepID=A0A516X510_9ACTN|nr:potassium channel family protein [Tomitella fengzijianii]QDQ98168.1 potassium channel family protein [Tomitella fengzijianii]
MAGRPGPGRIRRRLFLDDELTDRPDYDLVNIVRVPMRPVSPSRSIIVRLVLGVGMIVLSGFIVYLQRDGYQDVAGKPMTLLDSMYHATVSVTTTGFGDISPVSESARLVNILVITPLRMAFLVVLVGTTIEVLTERSRQAFKIQRWRQRLRDHTVVIGYGTKGRAAVDALTGDGVPPGEIVVVDTDAAVLEKASHAGLVTVQGSGSKADVLRLAGAQRAAAVIVAANRDDTAVLVTLTAREVAPKAKIVAAVRESEYTHLLEQSGADSVVVSSATAGRLLGVATSTPNVVDMIEDLLTPDEGFAIAEREVEPDEVGGSPRHLRDIVLAVVRNGEMLRAGTADVDSIEENDRLLYIRKA